MFVGGTSAETLLKLNIDKVIVPQLATEWTLDSSGTVWTIKLRDDVEFHEGWGKFTADDVIFSTEAYTVDNDITGWAGSMQRIFAAEGGRPGQSRRLHVYRGHRDSPV